MPKPTPNETKTGLSLKVLAIGPTVSSDERSFDCALIFEGEPAGEARLHLTDIVAFDAVAVGQTYELRGPVV